MNAVKVLLVVCGLSVSAMAQQAPEPPAPPTAQERELRGTFDQPMGRASRAEQVTIITQDNNGKKVHVEIRGDDVTAKIDGQDIPADRIRRQDGRLEILGEDGSVVFSTSTPRGGRAWMVQPRDGQNERYRALARVRPLEGFQWTPLTETEPAPRVMVGITMSEPDPTLLKHLGLGETGGGIVVDSVMEGMPAAAAGIKPYDIIIAINGKSPATQEVLREVLRGMNPGDELELKLVRQGAQQTVKVKVAERQAGPELFVPDDSGEAGGRFEAARKAIAEALKSLRENPDLQPEALREEAGKALEDAMKALGEAREGLAERYQMWMAPGSPDAPEAPGLPNMLFGPEGGMQMFRLPAMGAEVERRLGDFERRLDEIQKSLDAISRKLDEGKN